MLANPRSRDRAKAEFATLRLRLIKIAARVIETASACASLSQPAAPEADLFRSLPAVQQSTVRQGKPFFPSARNRGTSSNRSKISI